MAQFLIENDLWFTFRLECQRHQRKIPEVLSELVQVQIDAWHQERNEQEVTTAKPE